MATAATSQIQALKFEIVRDNKSNSLTEQPVSGYVTVASTDGASLDILQKLPHNGITEKFTLFYQNYAFSLLGASFKAVENAPRDLDNVVTFAFQAKDVILLRDTFGS